LNGGNRLDCYNPSRTRASVGDGVWIFDGDSMGLTGVVSGGGQVLFFYSVGDASNAGECFR